MLESESAELEPEIKKLLEEIESHPRFIAFCNEVDAMFANWPKQESAPGEEKPSEVKI